MVRTSPLMVANQGGVGQAPGICSAGWGKACGTITINGGTIESYGGSQSPSIGNGDSASCGNITISGTSTVVYAKKGSGQNLASIGWDNNGSLVR